jgi:hypothetical protein
MYLPADIGFGGLARMEWPRTVDSPKKTSSRRKNRHHELHSRCVPA